MGAKEQVAEGLAKKVKDLGLSFHDIMEGVGRGHAIAAARPGAAKVDPAARRAAQAAGNSAGVLEHYNKHQLLGEGVTANVGKGKSSSDKNAYLFFKKDGKPMNTEGDVEANMRLSPYAAADLGSDQAAQSLLRRSGQKSAIHFDATMLPPGLGGNAYQLAWDMLRPSGRANTIDVLTGVNQMRRPGNLMSYGLTHGDYGNIQHFPGSSIDPLPFDDSGQGGLKRFGLEGEALKNVFHDPYMRKQVENTGQEHIMRYSPDAQTGALALRELQMAKAHGSLDPSYLGAEPGLHTIGGLAHPMDLDALRYTAEKARNEGSASWSRPTRYDPAMGFGPGLLGRAGTTEAIIHGMHQGRTPEEIMEELLRYRGADEALKGRYAKGGAIHAAIAD